MSDANKVFKNGELDLVSIRSLSEGLVLVVSDGSLLVELLLECLDDSGYRVLIAQDDVEAARLYKETRPDLLISNIVMAKPEGLHFVKKLQGEYPNFKAVLMASCPQVVKDSFNDKVSELGFVCVIANSLNVMEVLATTHLILADRDIFHTQVRVDDNSKSQLHRLPPIFSPPIMPEQ